MPRLYCHCLKNWRRTSKKESPILTLKLSLLKTWSSRLNILNFMQAISSFFCEHSDLDWSTISSMAVFQFSFFAGCAAANASRVHKTKYLMALAGGIYPLRRNLALVHLFVDNEWGRSQHDDWCQWVGQYGIYTKAYRRTVQRTSKSRVATIPNTPPPPFGHGFSFRSVWSSIIEASLRIMPRLPDEGG